MNPSPVARSLRIGIAGAGQMARHHARAILATPHTELVGVADSHQPTVDEFCATFPVPGFSTLEELVHTGAIDVIHVCTPPATHERMAIQALEANCHVYVEKPFAETLASAERVLRVAESRNRRACAGHQLLFEAPALRAMQLLPMLGRVVHVESYFSFRAMQRNPDGRAPLRDDLQLLDILPHPVYLLLHFLKSTSEGRIDITALSLGKAGTVHALLQRGDLTGNLVVTLEGRPIESYLRIVGTNGRIEADFVRSTVQSDIGPGVSGIDKLLSPYRLARQLVADTTVQMTRRVLKRQRSYPGLSEIFHAFYQSVRGIGPEPVSPQSILETVKICEQVAQRMVHAKPAVSQAAGSATRTDVLVTGGTGFLGREVVRVLTEKGRKVRVLARREPPEWARITGADYVAFDISHPIPAHIFGSPQTVIHCAAETAGGWEQHQNNSIAAAENVMAAAAAAGVARLIHVSSLSVIEPNGKVVREETPLPSDGKPLGPYAWGKIESERLVLQRGKENGIEVKIVRPGAFVDYRQFEPPGLLGKRAGNFFVAVGGPGHSLGVVDITFSAQTLAWMVDHFYEAPNTLHLLAPEAPTKRQLLKKLRETNPDLTVVWLPTIVLVPLSWFAIGLQKILRPGRAAINVAKVFSRQRLDTTLIADLEPRIRAYAQESAANQGAASESSSTLQPADSITSR